MGLAASQARFLNLVARKTNIEYEGQQINQQRTTLANQSANYYNSMLTLSVPTPPSTESYKTTVYSVNYDGKKYTFNQITGSDSAAKIAYTYSEEITKARPVSTATVVKSGSNYKVDNVVLTQGSNTNVAADVLSEIRETSGYGNNINVGDIYFSTKQNGENVVYTYYLNKTKNGSSYTSVFPTSDGASAQGVAVYRQTPANEYFQGTWSNVTLTRDSYNRISSVSGGSLNFSNLAVTTTQITDDEAYNDAYNEYTYKTYLYQQQMENINAQTSVIQAQDKKLELRLKQLDTEQSAISQEMESVSSVIDKNMEDSFKAFA